jgi:signal peptidase II
MIGKIFFCGVWALVFLAADQGTKAWVRAALKPYQLIRVIPDFFNLVYIENPGAAFGLLAQWDHPARNLLMYFFFLVALAWMVWLVIVVPPPKKWVLFGVALLFGGALGNLWDRLVRGKVLDFLDFYWGTWHWPAFNAADICLTSGAGILILLSLLGKDWGH